MCQAKLQGQHSTDEAAAAIALNMTLLGQVRGLKRRLAKVDATQARPTDTPRTCGTSLRHGAAAVLSDDVDKGGREGSEPENVESFRHIARPLVHDNMRLVEAEVPVAQLASAGQVAGEKLTFKVPPVQADARETDEGLEVVVEEREREKLKDRRECESERERMERRPPSREALSRSVQAFGSSMRQVAAAKGFWPVCVCTCACACGMGVGVGSSTCVRKEGKVRLSISAPVVCRRARVHTPAAVSCGRPRVEGRRTAWCCLSTHSTGPLDAGWRMWSLLYQLLCMYQLLCTLTRFVRFRTRGAEWHST